jgi:hypothetical protein
VNIRGKWREGLAFPELVIVGMMHEVFPRGDFAMEMTLVHVGERSTPRRRSIVSARSNLKE